MANYFGISSDSVGILFGNTNVSSGSSSGSILSEYYSIKSGAYKKALRAYYAGMDKTDNNTKTNIKTDMSVSKDDTRTLAAIKNSADNMKDAEDALINNKDGYEDSEKVLSKVRNFVKNYNSMIDEAGKSSSSTINNTLKNVLNNTDINSRLLAKIGISIGEDGDLSIDEEKFKKADMNNVKTLFSGNGSYGYSVKVKAAMLSYQSANEASKSNTYNATGGYSYNYSTGDILSSYI